MKVVTRFAPSPTGYLHIGGARTALFNYLFAKHHGGEYRLRIEDTDAERNNPLAVQAIYDGLNWLGLPHDGEVVLQSKNRRRHMSVAMAMVENGSAYFDYTTPEEMQALKDAHAASGAKGPFRFRSEWRDKTLTPLEALERPHVIRLRAPQEGETVIEDAVQGRVAVQNSTLDDMILMRSDLTPTYMLAVVVDDHDMGVTHVIRGDDHLNNAFRQLPIYRAMGWPEPVYAHIPLIHDEKGQKYSKRSGAVAVGTFAEEKGILPSAMLNYLVKLGWGHGDDEIISREQMIEWFDLPGVGRAPARFDFKKLMSLNAHYLREISDRRLAPLLAVALCANTGDQLVLLTKAVASLKPRCTTVMEMIDMARFYIERPDIYVPIDQLTIGVLEALSDWTAETIEATIRHHAEQTGVKIKDVVAPLRLAVTGSKVSPPLFEAMALLGKPETIARLDAARSEELT